MAELNYCARTYRPCVGGAWDGGDGWGVDCAQADPEGCAHRVRSGATSAEVTLVVTRHPGLLTVLAEQEIATPATPVIAHATADDLRGKHVAGVLPLALAAECASVTEVALSLPPEARGRELTAAEVRQYMTGVRRYRVEVLPC